MIQLSNLIKKYLSRRKTIFLIKKFLIYLKRHNFHKKKIKSAQMNASTLCSISPFVIFLYFIESNIIYFWFIAFDLNIEMVKVFSQAIAAETQPHSANNSH